eukprot:sb/3475496/
MNTHIPFVTEQFVPFLLEEQGRILVDQDSAAGHARDVVVLLDTGEPSLDYPRATSVWLFPFGPLQPCRPIPDSYGIVRPVPLVAQRDQADLKRRGSVSSQQSVLKLFLSTHSTHMAFCPREGHVGL